MISIIIPILNEPGIADFLYQLHEVMSEIPCNYEILVVMGDREKLYPEIPNLPNQRVLKNYADSLERSVFLGLSCAKGDRVLVCDADGSHPIELIPDFLKGLDKYDMVVGVRDDKRLNVTFMRSIITKFFLIFAKLKGSHLSDPMSGFYGFRKEVINEICFHPIPWKTCLEIELKSNPTIYEIPFKFMNRNEGESKTSIKTGLKLIWTLLTI